MTVQKPITTCKKLSPNSFISRQVSSNASKIISVIIFVFQFFFSFFPNKFFLFFRKLCGVFPYANDSHHEVFTVHHALLSREWVGDHYGFSATHGELVDSQHCRLIRFILLTGVHVDAVLSAGLQIDKGTISHFDCLLSTLQVAVILEEDEGVFGGVHHHLSQMLLCHFLHTLASWDFLHLHEFHCLFLKGNQLHVGHCAITVNWAEIHSVPHTVLRQAVLRLNLALLGVRVRFLGESNEVVVEVSQFASTCVASRKDHLGVFHVVDCRFFFQNVGFVGVDFKCSIVLFSVIVTSNLHRDLGSSDLDI